MKQSTDYYVVLGVDANASTAVIKKAFKHLALQYHPDIYKGEDAKVRMQEILRAYQTLIDPERRRAYDLSRSQHMSGSSVSAEQAADESHHDRHAFVFPVFSDGAPAQIDLGAVTYLLSAREVRRLKEEGMLRGAKTPSTGGTYYCHRCRHQWQATARPTSCPNCKAQDWNEYLLLRCQHCHAVFESEQIRYEVGTLRYGNSTLCPPYELFPLCPSCGKAQWCPAEEERLWNVRDRSARKAKWRKRFGLE
jgi:DnaJ-class molecular chaperone with C-terminal Zn finger domain